VNGYDALDACGRHLALEVFDRTRTHGRTIGLVDHGIACLVRAVDMGVAVCDWHEALLDVY
jgi:hypothetical protein